MEINNKKFLLFMNANKQLYESIMKNISKSIKNILNESQKDFDGLLDAVSFIKTSFNDDKKDMYKYFKNLEKYCDPDHIRNGSFAAKSLIKLNVHAFKDIVEQTFDYYDLLFDDYGFEKKYNNPWYSEKTFNKIQLFMKNKLLSYNKVYDLTKTLSQLEMLADSLDSNPKRTIPKIGHTFYRLSLQMKEVNNSYFERPDFEELKEYLNQR